MTMYSKPLVESMVSLGGIKATLEILHSQITDSINGDEDEVIENVIAELGRIQEKLLSIGMEVNEPDTPSFRKVTLNEPGSTT